MACVALLKKQNSGEWSFLVYPPSFQNQKLWTSSTRCFTKTSVFKQPIMEISFMIPSKLYLNWFILWDPWYSLPMSDTAKWHNEQLKVVYNTYLIFLTTWEIPWTPSSDILRGTMNICSHINISTSQHLPVLHDFLPYFLHCLFLLVTYKTCGSPSPLRS